MGAIPLKTVTSHFPLAGENQTSEAPGVVFDPTIGEEGVETPLPNDSSKASLSPPLEGRLRSFRRDWQTNKCSSNVLNIITNGYVLPFLSQPNLLRFPLILSEYKTLPKDQALADCIQSLLSKNAIERVEKVKSLGFYNCLFLVPKPHQRWRPVIDLSRLNTFLHVEKFKMETPESIRTSLVPGEWLSSINLLDAYLHIPIHPNSRKYLQDLILRLKSKHVFTARCLMSLIGLLASTEKMVPEGHLHMRPFQFHLKEHWRYPQSLDSLLHWTDVTSAHLDWWQNPANMMKGADLHPKDHSIQLFTDASNEGWGVDLDQRSTQGLWSKATHKCPRVEGGLTGPLKFQGPVPGPNSSSCNLQLDSGSLHKQTRGNSLIRDVRSPVEDHDLVPPLSHNIKGQTHSGVSECDGRPPIQVQPTAVNRMVTASTGVQTDLPEVVHSSCGPVCHSSEPQTPSVCVSHPRPKGLGHRCSEHKLDGSHCLCLPSDGSPSQGDPKDQTMPLPDHRNSPRLARDTLVLGPSAALNRDPTTTPSVNDSTQTVPQVCVPQQPATAQRSGQLQEQGFSVEMAERIATPQRSSTWTIYKSKWALFEKWCRENSVDSPLHL